MVATPGELCNVRLGAQLEPVVSAVHDTKGVHDPLA